jgi:hypothetical protein
MILKKIYPTVFKDINTLEKKLLKDINLLEKIIIVVIHDNLDITAHRLEINKLLSGFNSDDIILYDINLSKSPLEIIEYLSKELFDNIISIPAFHLFKNGQLKLLFYGSISS